MASPSRREDSPVAEQLFAESYRFDFFQAVRLLELLARGAPGDVSVRSRSVGEDSHPHREVARFRSVLSLSFPAASIQELHRETGDDADHRDPPQMDVAFLGLFGPNGVLPQHYTSNLIERCHVRHKDYAQRDFFDLFNHRTISLFYRAWQKYRFPFAFERSQTEDPKSEDLFTYALLSLVGLGTDGLRSRSTTDPWSVLYYAGHFAHEPRNALALEHVLEDHFGLPIAVQQFRGQWLYLCEEEQSSLPTSRAPDGLNTQLGVSVIVGSRVWDVQSKFRIRVGPLTFAQFAQMMPIGDVLKPLCAMIRFYVGPQFDFETQAVLLAAEVPECQLTDRGIAAPRLGWNTWLKVDEFTRDAEEAVFTLPDV